MLELHKSTQAPMFYKVLNRDQSNSSHKKLKTKLVGGFNPSERYSSIGIIIPNIYTYIYIYIWKKMFQTTNQQVKWSLKCSHKDLHQKIEALQIEFLPFWVVFSAIPPLEHPENQQAITRHNLTAADDFWTSAVPDC